jgi:hypothetical protein
MGTAKDTLSGPLLKMSSFFLPETLPKVRKVGDVLEHARALRDRGIAPSEGEERLLKQLVWSLLQFQDNETDAVLYKALARVAALVLAIMEDDDLSIPDDRRIGSRADLGTLAAKLKRQHEKLAAKVAASPEARAITIHDAVAAETLERTLGPTADEELRHALHGVALHLRQGESILVKQTDLARGSRHLQRFGEACERAKHLIARLVAIPADADERVVRAHLVRRELKRVEVDALGAEVLTETEQTEKAKKLLAWVEVDMGEAVTEENRARLASELRAAAEGEPAPTTGEDDGAWLFDEA